MQKTIHMSIFLILISSMLKWNYLANIRETLLSWSEEISVKEETTPSCNVQIKL